MVLLLQTEEELNAFRSVIELVTEKGEESNTPDELNFLDLAVPQVEAFANLLYGKPLLCLECAGRINKDKATANQKIQG
jgi:hypothetical protein